jgi:carotenoid cleavage dioxygenase-like enzyme
VALVVFVKSFVSLADIFYRVIHVEQPLFAPRPNATAEDDGVLLTIWADMTTNTSFLQVLDGQSMQEVARAEMPYIIQAHFHGKWCPEGETYCVGL